MASTAAVSARPLRSRVHLRRRRLSALGVAVLVLVVSNIMSNRVLPAPAYVPWNLSVAVLLLFVAHLGGAGPVAVGLGIRYWHRPVGIGLLLTAGVALIFGIGMAIPATRDAFLDSRAATSGLGVMLYQVLVRIPLGTVVLEEVAFRGVLPALFGASPAIRWRWGPVLGASALFGLWHILPSIGIASGNRAVADVLGGNQLVTTVLAVLSMVAAGVLMCALARLGKGIKTTMLLHWATNSLGFVAAWLLLQ
ncbi:CPBP family intramembrane glutamic endopeptidase [Nakamurella endophytica]|uniref:CAAX amino protease n=1 Tax=Nakamurella endophytica TaxID=1748367 RepID=A0A917TBQ6_9ACTN|nr:CPBP family intramembrane glutamic endopeptidase [Nakamurella endophytica]GGM16889.1 CAAX amino protease [Nakamurella endophytica]